MRKTLVTLLTLACGAALAFEAKFEGEKVVFECPVAGTFRLKCQTGKVKLAASDGAVDFAVTEAKSNQMLLSMLVPPNFIQGGASMQFAMIPMNFLGKDQSADYANQGTWSNKALKQALREVNKLDMIKDADGAPLIPNLAEVAFVSAYNMKFYGDKQKQGFRGNTQYPY